MLNVAPAHNGQFGFPAFDTAAPPDLLAATTRPHARRVNGKYNSDNSIYVSLRDRWNQTLAALPASERNTIISRLSSAIDTFKNRYPTVDKFSHEDFRICRSLYTRLSHLLVDITIQRQLDPEWVLNIVEFFLAHQAMPVQVYHVPKDNVPLEYGPDDDFYASWDGQHTAVAFWIIATMIFNQDPSEVEIPVVLYDIKDRHECRMNFLFNNGKEGKKLLAPIDKIMQMIYAVRLDDSTNLEWRQVEQKQQYLESKDLFLTDKKFFDHKEPGAITRPGDICDEKITPELVRQFTIYADRVLARNNRPINTKELPIILGFLRMAALDNITYTDQEIENLADLCLDLFDADFDESGRFWHQVGIAYTKWHEKQYEDYDMNIRPGIRLNKDWHQGGTFFYFQLYFTWKNSEGERMRLPKLNINTPFLPNKKDLFQR